MISFGNKISGFIKNTYYSALALLGEKFGYRTLTMISLKEKQNETKKVGIVVAPSTGDAEKDTELKNTIKNSFSDEVRVYPDGDESSGALRPVFKNTTEDQDYLYVVVPIKNWN